MHDVGMNLLFEVATRLATLISLIMGAVFCPGAAHTSLHSRQRVYGLTDSVHNRRITEVTELCDLEPEFGAQTMSLNFSEASRMKDEPDLEPARRMVVLSNGTPENNEPCVSKSLPESREDLR